MLLAQTETLSLAFRNDEWKSVLEWIRDNQDCVGPVYVHGGSSGLDITLSIETFRRLTKDLELSTWGGDDLSEPCDRCGR